MQMHSRDPISRAPLPGMSDEQPQIHADRAGDRASIESVAFFDNGTRHRSSASRRHRSKSVLSQVSPRHSQNAPAVNEKRPMLTWSKSHDSDISGVVRFGSSDHQKGSEGERLEQIMTRMELHLERQLLEISSLLRNAGPMQHSPHAFDFDMHGSILPKLPNFPINSAFSSKSHSRRASRVSANAHGGGSGRASVRASVLVSDQASTSAHVQNPRKSQKMHLVLPKLPADSQSGSQPQPPSRRTFFQSAQPSPPTVHKSKGGPRKTTRQPMDMQNHARPSVWIA